MLAHDPGGGLISPSPAEVFFLSMKSTIS